MTYPGIENDPQLLVDNPDLAAGIQHLKDVAAEYSVWVAVRRIEAGAALVAVPGDEIPASTVDRLKWDEMGLVDKRTSKAGREVLERTGKATTEERDRWAAEDKAEAEKARVQDAEQADAKPARAPAKSPGKDSATEEGGK